MGEKGWEGEGREKISWIILGLDEEGDLPFPLLYILMKGSLSSMDSSLEWVFSFLFLFMRGSSLELSSLEDHNLLLSFGFGLPFVDVWRDVWKFYWNFPFMRLS